MKIAHPTKKHRELHLPNFGKNELESPDFSLVFETVGTNEFQAKRAQSY
jgi:hypothetical protein